MKDNLVVAVAWYDAHYNTSEMDISEITHRPVVYISVGILLKSDEVGVTVATDLGEDGKWRGINFVPRGMVKDEWPVGALLKKIPRPRIRQAVAPHHPPIA